MQRVISVTAFGQEAEGLFFSQGETVLFDIYCQDPITRDPIDLTGANVIMSVVALNVKGLAIQPPFISRQADIIGPSSEGHINVQIVDGDTVPTPLPPIPPGKKGVDLWLTDSLGNRLALLFFGELDLLPAATLPTTVITPLPSQVPLAQGPPGTDLEGFTQALRPIPGFWSETPASPHLIWNITSAQLEVSDGSNWYDAIGNLT